MAIEGDEAQVQQAGVADHDVQAQRQQHEEQCDVGDAHPGVALGSAAAAAAPAVPMAAIAMDDDLFRNLNSWRVLPQARSATRSPSRPEGRSVSMMISTMNAKMSL